MKPGERERNHARALLVGGLVGLLGLHAGRLSAGAESAALDTAWLRRMGFEAIPLRRTEEHHLYVSGRANGRRASCLVDTGWSYSTLRPGLAGTEIPLADLALGRARFTNLSVRVERILFNRQPASFDLVLGLDFLRQYEAVLDCGQRRLCLRRQPLAKAERRDLEVGLRTAGFRDISLTLKVSAALTAPARVNGEPVELLVDSGAVWSCLDQRQAARLGLKPQPSSARIIGAGGTGVRPVAVVEVKRFELGTVSFRPATFALLDLADWQLAATNQPLAEVQGILGGDWLAANAAVIDCGSGKLWVKPRSRR